MCPYSELFLSAYSRIRTKYGEILRIFSYSVQMPTRTTPNTDTFYTVKDLLINWDIILLFT